MLAEQKFDPFETPCIIEDLPFEQYLELDAASSHALATLLNKSPLHMRAGIDKPSHAKGLGTLVHAMLLTPQDVDEQVVIKPAGADKASNASKTKLVNWLIEATGTEDPPVDASLSLGKQLDAKLSILEPALQETGLTVCSESDKTKAEEMVGNVLAKNLGRVIFADGVAESTMMAVDPVSGVLCKIRPDWLPAGHDLIVDLKSAASVAFDEFSRAAARFNYPIQAALYPYIYSVVKEKPRPSFLHAVVENEPPFDCAFFEMDGEALGAGEKQFRRALDIWSRCEKSGKWPGVGWDFHAQEYTIQSLSLPRWAL